MKRSELKLVDATVSQLVSELMNRKKDFKLPRVRLYSEGPADCEIAQEIEVDFSGEAEGGFVSVNSSYRFADYWRVTFATDKCGRVVLELSAGAKQRSSEGSMEPCCDGLYQRIVLMDDSRLAALNAGSGPIPYKFEED